MSPRPDPQERRQEILDAAMRCFARTGYHQTSMDDIVAESGLSKGTLYWYFKSKRELFFALFDRILSEMLEPLPAFIEIDAPVVERLRILGKATTDAVINSTELTSFPLNFMMEAWLDDTVSDHYFDMLQQFANILEKLLKEGIANGELREMDTFDITWGMMAMLDGIVLYYLAGMPGDVTKVASAMMETLIEGMIKRDES
jgi:AcrR family transcriptional regulator